MTADDKSPDDIAAAAALSALADEASVGQALREHAEVLTRSQSAPQSDRLATLSPEATRDLLHELQVHRIELEMQNDELRRTQVEHDASRARYFNLFDLAPVGYCSLSEQGLILQANLAAAALLGATRSTLVKQPISRFIFKADQDTWYLHRKLLAETGQAQSLQLRLVQQDGAQVWVQVAARAANEASGPPVMLVVLSDISDRKLMEAAMRESEARFRALVEWSPEAMLVHRDGDVIYANPAAVRMLGARTANELVDKTLLDLIHPASHPAMLGGLKNVSNQRGDAPMVQVRCLRLDGTLWDVEVQSIATAYDGQQVTLTSLHDLSARQPADGVASP